MIEIDGKKYELKEAYTIDANDVETRWAQNWDEEDGYDVNVATDIIRVEKVFVLVELREESKS